MKPKPDTHPFIDLFDAHGGIQARCMFGGFGIYVDGRIVGIVVRERIYLKTDDETRKPFIAEKCKPFTYQKRTGKGVSLRYYAIPERLYDEPDIFAHWVRQAEMVSAAAPKTKRLTTASRAGRAKGNKRRPA
jgi:DNA transformation protein